MNILFIFIRFANLGIQCVKKREVAEALNARKSINVDPYQSMYANFLFLENRLPYSDSFKQVKIKSNMEIKISTMQARIIEVNVKTILLFNHDKLMFQKY